MQIVNLKLGDLKPYENNPRINEGAVDSLAEIISKLGLRFPFSYWEMVILFNPTRSATSC